MSRFLQTSIGWINLDHILLIQRDRGYPGPDAHNRYILEKTDGSALRCSIVGDFQEEPEILVPAAPGLEAWVVYVDDDPCGGYKLAEGRDEPILAWKREGDSMSPVFLRDLSSNERAFLRFENGSVQDLSYDGALFDNMEDALKAFLREYEREQEFQQRLREKVKLGPGAAQFGVKTDVGL